MRSNILLQLPLLRSGTKCGVLAILICISAISTAQADCGHTIVLSNWRSCAVGTLSANGGNADWVAVPAWTKDRRIQPYFHGEPRLLANHGLCNEKFRRVVLCLPGWEESQDKKACWYQICAGNLARKR